MPLNDNMGTRDNVILILKDGRTGKVKKVIEAHNIVTNAGDKYYAQLGAGEAASLTFANIVVAASYLRAETKVATFADLTGPLVSGAAKAFDSGYPKTSDDDTDNTGADSDIVTWRASWGTTEGNTNILALCIAQTGAATSLGGNSTNLVLNFATLSASVGKTNVDTLKVFVNHQFLGV